MWLKHKTLSSAGHFLARFKDTTVAASSNMSAEACIIIAALPTAMHMQTDVTGPYVLDATSSTVGK
jgi:hypothetical protein